MTFGHGSPDLGLNREWFSRDERRNHGLPAAERQAVTILRGIFTKNF